MAQTGREKKARPGGGVTKPDIREDSLPGTFSRSSKRDISASRTTHVNPYRELAILLLNACDGVIDLDIDDKGIVG